MMLAVRPKPIMCLASRTFEGLLDASLPLAPKRDKEVFYQPVRIQSQGRSVDIAG